MFCTKCQNDLADCTCPDIKERLASLNKSSNFLTRVCMLCGHHYSQCDCHDPEWTVNTDPIFRSRWLEKK